MNGMLRLRAEPTGAGCTNNLSEGLGKAHFGARLEEYPLTFEMELEDREQAGGAAAR